jgi:hypothetical protein
MRVLIACEYSGTVREAFRRRGHDAWSCDLLQSDDNSPYHIQGDCIPVIKQGWDIIIMHPPCTALAVSGNAHYGTGMAKHNERLNSIQWTIKLFELAKQHAAGGVAMENPVGVLPIKATQYIQPYMFGHTEQKKTGLWLHGLPPLIETNNVYNAMMLLPRKQRERLHFLSPTLDRWKIRSTTYQGIADAMAAQWGEL